MLSMVSVHQQSEQNSGTCKWEVAAPCLLWITWRIGAPWRIGALSKKETTKLFSNPFRGPTQFSPHCWANLLHKILEVVGILLVLTSGVYWKRTFKFECALLCRKGDLCSLYISVCILQRLAQTSECTELKGTSSFQCFLFISLWDCCLPKDGI